MDFDLLPEPAFLRLLEFLPITDRLRVGRVSQRFRQLSLVAVSRTRWLDVGDIFFDKLDINDARRLLTDLLSDCAHNLRVLKFDVSKVPFSFRIHFQCFASLAFSSHNPGNVFVRSTFPRLIELDFGQSFLSNEHLTRIIVDHSSTLERVGWASRDLRLSDDGTVFDRLQHLDLRRLNSRSIESLINRVPNLISLKVTLDSCSTDALDRFLCSVPRLRSFEAILVNDKQLELKKSRVLFQLPLTCLRVRHNDAQLTPYKSVSRGGNTADRAFDDGSIRLILDSFPNLEELSLYWENVHRDGVKMLKEATSLRHLTFHKFDDIVQQMRFTIDCPNLEVLEMRNCTVSETRFGAILRKIPSLRRIIFRGFRGVRTVEEAVGMLARFANLDLVPREITLVFVIGSNSDRRKYSEIWETDATSQGLAQTKDRNGLEIRIEKINQSYLQQEIEEDSELDNEMEEEEQLTDEDEK